MGKVILVTGASQGIGAATAVLAGERGYSVCVNYLSSEDAADATVEAIRGAGGRAIAVRADVGSEDDVERLFARVDRELGPITTLVNNAGILETQARLVDISRDRLLRVLTTNVAGCFLCAREAVKRMSTARGGQGGSIVNVSSGAARSGSPGEYIDYAASKGAIDTMTIGLAKEVAGEGIRVNAVRPGFIYTGIHARGGEPDRVDRLKARIPLKRGGEPMEVARAILWLASDEASYSTGTFLDTTGGA